MIPHPTPTPFPELMARATKETPEQLSHWDFINCERATNRAKNELIRRALAFFAAGGYDALRHFRELAEDYDHDSSIATASDLIRILDGVDAGTGEEE